VAHALMDEAHERAGDDRESDDGEAVAFHSKKPNVRAEAGRTEGVQHETKTQSRRCLQHAR
jgi:hypothetical protein